MRTGSSTRGVAGSGGLAGRRGVAVLAAVVVPMVLAGALLGPVSADTPSPGPAQPAAAASSAAAAAQVPVDATSSVLVPAADGEVVSLRSATSRTYVQAGRGKGAGGYVTQVSASPVNYQDANHVWQKIDPTLVSAAGGWSSVGPGAAHLPTVLGSAPFSVAVPGGSVGFQVVGAAAVSGSMSGSQVTYAGALQGVSLTEQVTGNGLRELAVLGSSVSTSSWTTAVTMPAAATLTAAAGGAAVTSAAGAVLGSVPAPTATDATGATAPAGAVTMTVGTDGRSLVTAVSPAWLMTPGLVFPVTVDPDSWGPPAATRRSTRRTRQRRMAAARH